MQAEDAAPRDDVAAPAGVLVPTAKDIDACAREPIRVPGGIQPHGALLVLDPATLAVVQASSNAEDFLGGFDRARGLSSVDGGKAAEAQLAVWRDGDDAVLLRTLAIGGVVRQMLAHRTDQGLIVEFEAGPTADSETLEALYPRLRRFLEGLDGARELAPLCQTAAEEVRSLTQFDRVLIYQFDEDWNGAVIAEDNNGVLPSYMDLRFPASDIPAQARELYRLNRLRLIASADYAPAPIEPAMSPVDGRPLDLSFAALRSVSPVHLEYMRNMGSLASMSVSIVLDGRLWGLIACHNATPRQVSAHIRAACDFLGQMLALQIGSVVRLKEAAERLRLKSLQNALVATLAVDERFGDALARQAAAWIGLTNAAGAAIATSEEVKAVGAAPPDEDIQAIVRALEAQGDGDLFATDAAAEHFEGSAFGDEAAGILAVSISRLHPSYILWFRPEVVKTVTWAGDPRKPRTADDRLHPRQSFKQWTEQVRGRSLPWTDAEIESAREFRTAVLNFVLERAEERAELTDELRRSNKELEAFSYSVSHDLRAPFRHIVGYAELLREKERDLQSSSRHYLESITEAALSAGRLVDDLLAFSQTGRASLHPSRIDMGKMVQEVRRILEPETEGRAIEWSVGALPVAHGDPTLLRQALLNLVANAIKFTRGKDPAVISISGVKRQGSVAYTVSDNGVGFDGAYIHKLFGVFQRLHRTEDFEGTGIGLALTKRIIERHGGEILAEGEVGRGATFTFTLPLKTPAVAAGQAGAIEKETRLG